MIAIPNMELPKGCDECPLTDGVRCKARDKDIIEFVIDFFASYHEKPTDCPLIDIVTCGECKHRPIKDDPDGEDYGFNIVESTDGDDLCPCLVEDGWYSWMPNDNFYCGRGERRSE